MRLTLSIALLFSLAPAFAVAKPRPASVHVRQQEYRDRTPKARVHGPRARQNAQREIMAGITQTA